MNARSLALALVVSLGAACAATEDDPQPNGNTGTIADPVQASWSASAGGVTCSGADRQVEVQESWADLDGDGVVAYFPATWPAGSPPPADFAPGAPDPGDLEATTVCVWWCGRYDGAPPVTPAATHEGVPQTVGVSFARRAGIWTPVQFYTWTPQCF